jgi:hypothetical protein
MAVCCSNTKIQKISCSCLKWSIIDWTSSDMTMKLSSSIVTTLLEVGTEDRHYSWAMQSWISLWSSRFYMDNTPKIYGQHSWHMPWLHCVGILQALITSEKSTTGFHKIKKFLLFIHSVFVVYNLYYSIKPRWQWCETVRDNTISKNMKLSLWKFFREIWKT